MLGRTALTGARLPRAVVVAAQYASPADPLSARLLLLWKGAGCVY